jgi:DNA-binding winged helix-turn-helix (wHTH) protein/Tol biopolymer transport system component
MMGNKSFVFRFADVEVREREFSLTKAGEALPVEPKAFRVLLLLLRNPQKLITKDELMNAVWGDIAVSDNSLTRSIATLRRLLGDDTRTPRFIETVATVGYRWVSKVELSEEASGEAEPSPDPQLPSRRLPKWLIPSVIILVAGLALAVWYASPPLPPPRVTAYTQITHDGRQKFLGGTDGSRIYFTQRSPNAIVQIGVNGGETAPVPISLPSTFNQLEDISPDGSNALISTKEEGHQSSPLWVVPILGGAATRLGDGFGAFSPDGASVIYSTLEGDIFVVRVDGTENHKLASVGSMADWFSWSPDGKTIRFTKDDMLWEMSSNGSGLHRLLPGWHEQGVQRCGMWTPDGRLYAFQLFKPSVGGEIWVLEEGHRPFRRMPSEPVRLTTGPMLWGSPHPSRDGKKIFATGRTPRGELSRIDAKTGGIQPFLSGISAEFVSFSGDGKSVAYVSYPEGILWKANRDGSNRMRLSGPPDYPFNPQWSADSKQILFNSLTPQTPQQPHSAIYLIPTEGGTPRKLLLPDDDVQIGDANWSPDGKRILFDWGWEDGPPEKRDLRILDLNSRQITTIPGSTGLRSSRWSPDGRYIAAFADPQTPVLRVFDLTTQRWAALPTSGDVGFPSFSHDSRLIYFLRYGRDQGVFRISVTGGKEERVVDGTQWHTTGYFGYSMSLDPTDAPLILRDVGSDDIYALTLEER